MKINEAWALLGVTGGASPLDVRRAYRRETMREHQAAGPAGCETALRLLAEARDLAVRHAVQAPCPVCAGSGKVRQTAGVMALRLSCPRCCGTGRMHPS